MLYFPQVGHLFIPGSTTKELMLLVDSCETINESMVQLIFQVCIVMPSILSPSGNTPSLTTLQILVLVKTFIMASKGAADEFLAAKMRSIKEDKKTEGQGKPAAHELKGGNQGQDFIQCFGLKTEVTYYHEMGIVTKLRMIGM